MPNVDRFVLMSVMHLSTSNLLNSKRTLSSLSRSNDECAIFFPSDLYEDGILTIRLGIAAKIDLAALGTLLAC